MELGACYRRSRVRYYSPSPSLSPVFLDAPHILQPVDLFGDTPESLDSPSDPNLAPRGWWKFEDAAKTIVIGLEATLVLIRDTLHGSKFDVRSPMVYLVITNPIILVVGGSGFQVAPS